MLSYRIINTDSFVRRFKGNRFISYLYIGAATNIYRRMGKTGLQLSVLSFGSWVSFHKQISDVAADELMGIAYDNGVNFFDNAEVYALGESEKMR
jgi:hypothetical protein